MVVYQFSKLSDWLAQNVFNRVIYLNSPVNFNDPTENNFSIKDIESCTGGEAFKENVIKSMAESLEKSYKKNKSYMSGKYSDDDKNSFINHEFEKVLSKHTNKLLENIPGDDATLFCHQVVKDAQMEFRVASLTKKKENPLMWGHYADGMRGVCIEYEIDDEDLNKVRYEDCYKVDVVNILAGGADEEVKKTFLRKNSNWSYEKEYRIIKVGERFHPLRKDQLKKIYFGYKCDEEKADFIKNLSIERFGSHVEFYLVRNLVNSYYMLHKKVSAEELVDGLKEMKEMVNKHETFVKDEEMKAVFDLSLEAKKKGE